MTPMRLPKLSWQRRPAALLFAVAALLGTSVAAADAGTAKPVGAVRALAVSVPPDPVPIKAGSQAKTLVRVVNPNNRPVTVTVTDHALSLGNDGKVSIAPGHDPVWAHAVHFPPNHLTIPGLSYLDVPLTIRVPTRLSPDLYFIGFLVTPLATGSGSLQVINQIGSFLTVDVPGPRLRRIAAGFQLPSFVLGSHANGKLRVTNIGTASLRFWGENDSKSWPGGGSVAQQERLNPALLPAGRYRTFTVSQKPTWPVGIVTMSVHLYYPGRTESSALELTMTKRVILVSPWVLVAIALLVFVVVWLFARSRRRRRRKRGATLQPLQPHPVD